jgi:outer membrane receptor protein involved in Fe transport
LTHYAALSWQHSHGLLDWQSSLTARYSSLGYAPDPIGDLLYDGIAQHAYKRAVAYGWQADGSCRASAAHTLRAGLYLQHDRATSATSAQVLPLDAAGNQASDQPLTVDDNSGQGQWLASAYLQDEWQVAALTVNYGLRLDHYNAYSSGSQLSPRLNLVWPTGSGTTLHAGYSRYFTPPPFELVGSETIARFAGTSAAPEQTLNDRPVAERADYYDLGLQQALDASLVLGVDGYYRRSRHLIDEGQFGAPIVLTPFNYRAGLIKGVEFTANYSTPVLSAYANLALQSVRGRGIESAQFNFAAQELAYIEAHAIHLDHEQQLTGSAGATYLWRGTRLSADLLLGTGLRRDQPLPDGSNVPNGAHLPGYTQVNLGLSHAFPADGPRALTLRCDVINVFDQVYEIRDGSGVGVGAPQLGPRRGLFLGLSQGL